MRMRMRGKGPVTTDELDPIEPADDTDEPERGPLRRCAVTRERLPRETMLRFVVSPDRMIVPDVAGRLPGRGIWLSARQDVIQAARAKGAFARAARSAVLVPPDLLPGLVAALERRIGDHIGLARRAGQAVSGFDKARVWLQGGKAALVIQAADGSSEERARFLGRHAQTVPVVAPIDGAALGAVFGRERAVHVAVAAGRLADGLLADAGRLAGLRGAHDAAPRHRTIERDSAVR
jgi:predicted RNA-binding protein YlxR (DUF448 family)